MQEAKWLSKESLQIAEERREVKPREKGKDILNWMQSSRELPGDKAFLNEQCKVEESNRMGKIRDLVKKVGEIKGTFHAKIGMIKHRNSKDRIEAEDIRK